ncbi:hypothetical protein L249_8171, partial [Ophiocordyceps polyrhachis-furcata BCC 54312]
YPARNFKNAPIALQEYYNRYVNAPGPPLVAAAANKLYNDDDDDNRATITAVAPRDKKNRIGFLFCSLDSKARKTLET